MHPFKGNSLTEMSFILWIGQLDASKTGQTQKLHDFIHQRWENHFLCDVGKPTLNCCTVVNPVNIKVAVSMFRQAEHFWYFPSQQLYRCEYTNTCLMWNGHLKHLRAESMEKVHTAGFFAQRRHFSVSPKIQVLKHKQEKHWVVRWFGANVITARATNAAQPGLRAG